MSKIEVGEYVRTDNGEIHKVLDTEKGSIKIKSQYKEWIGLCCIKKHSKQLIDLIEVGDVIKYFSNYLGRKIKIEVIFTCNRENDYKWDLGYVGTNIDDYIMIEEIKEILTKEQYMANCYKVGGKDEELTI